MANAAISLGMTVYGYDPYLSVDAAWGMHTSVIHATSLRDIYENCDYITLHVPCNTETKGMINASSILSLIHIWQDRRNRLCRPDIRFPP